jgi:hypothetical protein
MSTWGTRRRNLIITIFLSAVFITVATTGYVFWYEEPTCFDGKQNGIETGIDCGGSCKLICSDESIEPLVKWTRYFEVIPGVYNVVAYLENQNNSASTEKLDYKFTLYDNNNAIIADKSGSIDMQPKQVVPIIENGLRTGQLQPARMTFEITNEVVWENDDPRQSTIFITDDLRTQIEGQPRVTATLENRGLNTVYDIDSIVILYNTEDNAIGVSSTYVEEIRINEKRDITFTWPQNFVGEVARFEIISLYENN